MRSPHAVTRFVIAGAAGDHDAAPVHTHPHVNPRHKEGVAVMAELPAESMVDPDPLAHGDPAGEPDIPVTHLRVTGKCKEGLAEEHRYPFLGDLLRC